MQALTDVQLFQILSMVSTSVTNDAKSIMSGWVMRSRLSYWDIWSTKELFWRMKMGNQRRTSMHAERCKPAHWDSWSGAPRHHNLLDLPALMWAEWCSGSHKVPEVEVYGMAVDERCPMHGCMLIWGHDVSVPTVLSWDAKEGLDSVSCWNLVLFPRCL